MGKQPNDLRMRQVTFKSVSASLPIHSVIFFVVVVRYLEIGTNTQYILEIMLWFQYAKSLVTAHCCSLYEMGLGVDEFDQLSPNLLVCQERCVTTLKTAV